MEWGWFVRIVVGDFLFIFEKLLNPFQKLLSFQFIQHWLN
ncbi:hypothetical protein HMPREF1348_00387 [Enterococcus faecium 505]|uniref:Uncharacterized protein n=1 Tax=Enterococcus faecium 505 TaxID=1134806 RepID=J7CXC8_ENTFC|nr:hypothetical protein HMPREF1348_00387 [Enterococcus faecium 505]